MSRVHRISLQKLTIPGSIVMAMLLSGAASAHAQTPRTASGKPDFSGTYDAATLTPLTRPKEYGDNLYLTPEEAKEIAE